MTDFTAAYARILEATGARTQAELAKTLGIRQSSISDAKCRNSLPACWLLQLYRSHRLNPDWILTGEGHKHLAPAGDTPEVQVIVKGLEEFTPNELLNELKRRFPGFTLNLTMTGGEHSPLAEEAADQACAWFSPLSGGEACPLCGAGDLKTREGHVASCPYPALVKWDQWRAKKSKGE